MFEKVQNKLVNEVLRGNVYNERTVRDMAWRYIKEKISSQLTMGLLLIVSVWLALMYVDKYATSSKLWHTAELPTILEWQKIINTLGESQGVNIKEDGKLTSIGAGETEEAWNSLTYPRYYTIDGEDITP